ncbi:hypothetical protein C8F01DRAFT_1232578 [Mycena amicta]|nr:hypothetical protein C8F01DRAFT_1232578 [Mycena amicta]
MASLSSAGCVLAPILPPHEYGPIPVSLSAPNIEPIWHTTILSPDSIVDEHPSHRFSTTDRLDCQRSPAHLSTAFHKSWAFWKMTLPHELVLHAGHARSCVPREDQWTSGHWSRSFIQYVALPIRRRPLTLLTASSDYSATFPCHGRCPSPTSHDILPLHHSTVVPTLSPAVVTALASIGGVPPGTAMRALSLPTHHFVTTHNVSVHPIHRFRHRIRFMPNGGLACTLIPSHPIAFLYRLPQRLPIPIPAQSRPRETPKVVLLVGRTFVTPRAVHWVLKRRMTVDMHPGALTCLPWSISSIFITNVDLDHNFPARSLPFESTCFRWGHVLWRNTRFDQDVLVLVQMAPENALRFSKRSCARARKRRGGYWCGSGGRRGWKSRRYDDHEDGMLLESEKRQARDPWTRPVVDASRRSGNYILKLGLSGDLAFVSPAQPAQRSIPRHLLCTLLRVGLHTPIHLYARFLAPLLHPVAVHSPALFGRCAKSQIGIRTRVQTRYGPVTTIDGFEFRLEFAAPGL